MQDDDKFLNKRDYEEKRQYDRYMDKKQQQDKYSSKATEAESRSKSCKSSPKRHTEEKSEIRHNDHKSVKRKLEDDDESDSKQKHKKSKRSHEDKSHHSKHSKHSSSKPDMKAEGSKHTKSSSRDSKSDGPSTLEKSKSHKSSKHKAKDMDKDQEQNHSSSKPKHKENGKDKPREHKQHKSKSDRDRDRESKESKTHVKKEKSKQEKATVKKLTEGIDSGSGASFAEALGMLEPCSSKTVIKYKKVNSPSEERERPREKSYKLDTPPQRKTFEKSPSPVSRIVALMRGSRRSKYFLFWQKQIKDYSTKVLIGTHCCVSKNAPFRFIRFQNSLPQRTFLDITTDFQLIWVVRKPCARQIG